jgi:23S rRNA (pseudouridine1915-N3)-methyltransferase
VYPIRLIIVGSPKQKSILSLQSHYEKLIKTYIRLEILEVQEGRGQLGQQLSIEAKRIKNALHGFQRQILLDAGGALRKSEEFASWLGPKIDLGESLAFAIGSSNGFHSTLKTDIKEHISLSPMTFPHDLSQVMFLEQLYRAFTILQKKIYHK